jgi:hypothetical protein
MKRALIAGYAAICFLQVLITLIKVFEEYTDPYIYSVKDWLIAFDFCGIVIYLIGLGLSGTKYGWGDEQIAFAIVGALILCAC